MLANVAPQNLKPTVSPNTVIVANNPNFSVNRQTPKTVTVESVQIDSAGNETANVFDDSGHSFIAVRLADQTVWQLQSTRMRAAADVGGPSASTTASLASSRNGQHVYPIDQLCNWCNRGDVTEATFDNLIDMVFSLARQAKNDDDISIDADVAEAIRNSFPINNTVDDLNSIARNSSNTSRDKTLLSQLAELAEVNVRLYELQSDASNNETFKYKGNYGTEGHPAISLMQRFDGRLESLTPIRQDMSIWQTKAQINERFDFGAASGRQLNCLLHSLCQLQHNDRNFPEGSELEIKTRAELVREGYASESGYIDLFSTIEDEDGNIDLTNTLVHKLSNMFRVRINVLQACQDPETPPKNISEVKASTDPTIRDDIFLDHGTFPAEEDGKPIVNLLNRRKHHFEPLWPRANERTLTATVPAASGLQKGMKPFPRGKVVVVPPALTRPAKRQLNPWHSDTMRGRLGLPPRISPSNMEVESDQSFIDTARHQHLTRVSEMPRQSGPAGKIFDEISLNPRKYPRFDEIDKDKVEKKKKELIRERMTDPVSRHKQFFWDMSNFQKNKKELKTEYDKRNKIIEIAAYSSLFKDYVYNVTPNMAAMASRALWDFPDNEYVFDAIDALAERFSENNSRDIEGLTPKKLVLLIRTLTITPNLKAANAVDMLAQQFKIRPEFFENFDGIDYSIAFDGLLRAEKLGSTESSANFLFSKYNRERNKINDARTLISAIDCAGHYSNNNEIKIISKNCFRQLFSQKKLFDQINQIGFARIFSSFAEYPDDKNFFSSEFISLSKYLVKNNKIIQKFDSYGLAMLSKSLYFYKDQGFSKDLTELLLDAIENTDFSKQENSAQSLLRLMGLFIKNEHTAGREKAFYKLCEEYEKCINPKMQHSFSDFTLLYRTLAKFAGTDAVDRLAIVISKHLMKANLESLISRPQAFGLLTSAVMHWPNFNPEIAKTTDMLAKTYVNEKIDPPEGVEQFVGILRGLSKWPASKLCASATKHLLQSVENYQASFNVHDIVSILGSITTFDGNKRCAEVAKDLKHRLCIDEGFKESADLKHLAKLFQRASLKWTSSLDVNLVASLAEALGKKEIDFEQQRLDQVIRVSAGLNAFADDKRMDELRKTLDAVLANRWGVAVGQTEAEKETGRSRLKEDLENPDTIRNLILLNGNIIDEQERGKPQEGSVSDRVLKLAKDIVEEDRQFQKNIGAESIGYVLRLLQYPYTHGAAGAPSETVKEVAKGLFQQEGEPLSSLNAAQITSAFYNLAYHNSDGSLDGILQKFAKHCEKKLQLFDGLVRESRAKVDHLLSRYGSSTFRMNLGQDTHMRFKSPSEGADIKPHNYWRRQFNILINAHVATENDESKKESILQCVKGLKGIDISLSLSLLKQEAEKDPDGLAFAAEAIAKRLATEPEFHNNLPRGEVYGAISHLANWPNSRFCNEAIGQLALGYITNKSLQEKLDADIDKYVRLFVHVSKLFNLNSAKSVSEHLASQVKQKLPSLNANQTKSVLTSLSNFLDNKICLLAFNEVAKHIEENNLKINPPIKQLVEQLIAERPERPINRKQVQELARSVNQAANIQFVSPDNSSIDDEAARVERTGAKRQEVKTRKSRSQTTGRAEPKIIKFDRKKVEELSTWPDKKECRDALEKFAFAIIEGSANRDAMEGADIATCIHSFSKVRKRKPFTNTVRALLRDLQVDASKLKGIGFNSIAETLQGIAALPDRSRYGEVTKVLLSDLINRGASLQCDDPKIVGETLQVLDVFEGLTDLQRAVESLTEILFQGTEGVIEPQHLVAALKAQSTHPKNEDAQQFAMLFSEAVTELPALRASFDVRSLFDAIQSIQKFMEATTQVEEEEGEEQHECYEMAAETLTSLVANKLSESKFSNLDNVLPHLTGMLSTRTAYAETLLALIASNVSVRKRALEKMTSSEIAELFKCAGSQTIRHDPSAQARINEALVMLLEAFERDPEYVKKLTVQDRAKIISGIGISANNYEPLKKLVANLNKLNSKQKDKIKQYGPEDIADYLYGTSFSEDKQNTQEFTEALAEYIVADDDLIDRFDLRIASRSVFALGQMRDFNNVEQAVETLAEAIASGRIAIEPYSQREYGFLFSGFAKWPDNLNIGRGVELLADKLLAVKSYPNNWRMELYHSGINCLGQYVRLDKCKKALVHLNQQFQRDTHFAPYYSSDAIGSIVNGLSEFAFDDENNQDVLPSILLLTDSLNQNTGQRKDLKPSGMGLTLVGLGAWMSVSELAPVTTKLAKQLDGAVCPWQDFTLTDMGRIANGLSRVAKSNPDESDLQFAVNRSLSSMVSYLSAKPEIIKGGDPLSLGMIAKGIGQMQMSSDMSLLSADLFGRLDRLCEAYDTPDDPDYPALRTAHLETMGLLANAILPFLRSSKIKPKKRVAAFQTAGALQPIIKQKVDLYLAHHNHTEADVRCVSTKARIKDKYEDNFGARNLAYSGFQILKTFELVSKRWHGSNIQHGELTNSDLAEIAKQRREMRDWVIDTHEKLRPAIEAVYGDMSWSLAMKIEFDEEPTFMLDNFIKDRASELVNKTNVAAKFELAELRQSLSRPFGAPDRGRGITTRRVVDLRAPSKEILQPEKKKTGQPSVTGFARYIYEQANKKHKDFTKHLENV